MQEASWVYLNTMYKHATVVSIGRVNIAFNETFLMSSLFGYHQTDEATYASLELASIWAMFWYLIMYILSLYLCNIIWFLC